MLVKSAGKRWERGAGINEIVEYFDRPEKKSWHLLSKKEAEVLQNEALLCTKNFSYAARNYFWIADKRGNDLLLRLTEGQELILDYLYRLRDQGKPQKLMILKARQLGCSTLIEALIAWRTMFFPNSNALVVSHNKEHAEYLFGIVLHIYDQMPWWLKPMEASRKIGDGLRFDNPIADLRRTHPGLHSLITVQAATQMSGIGQGYRLSAAHISEYSDYDQKIAREAIEGDIEKALTEDPETFGILESTGKGAGSYSHKLWMKNVELGANAKWFPVFLPWFFEKTRVLAPPQGWVLPKQEDDMRKRVFMDWVRCDNKQCAMWFEREYKGEDRSQSECPYCDPGRLIPFLLQDGQLRWMWQERVNAEKDLESIKTLRGELCTTATEAWQISGYQVFPDAAISHVQSTICQPIAKGNLDVHGVFHGVKTVRGGARCWCEGCTSNHTFDPDPLWIWEWPEPGEQYTVGVDVSEGIGEDYSVAWINKVTMYKDVHVVTYRSNDIDPYHFAVPVNFLGHWYNEALMSVEYNNYQTTADQIRNYFMYPNIFQWKHPDAIRQESNKYHWLTQMNTKPKLRSTAVRFLLDGVWDVRDARFLEEMKTFQKEDYDDRAGGAATGFHDDVCMAAMICLFTSHDRDFDPDFGLLRHPGAKHKLSTAGGLECKCLACGEAWDSEDIASEWRCIKCGSLRLSFSRKNWEETGNRRVNFDDMMKSEFGLEDQGIPSYDQL